MWAIVVTCMSLPVVCALNVDAPPVDGRTFVTRPQCETAIIQVYKKWKQGSAAYSFNCARVK